MAVGLTMLLEKKIERIILSRPAVEAGERLGFLPGDMKEKVDPYLRPLYDSLYDLFDFEKIQRMIEIGDIEIAPLALSLIHISEPTRRYAISYAVLCLKKKEKE